MAVMASWNGKTWGVSSQRIAALNGVSSSVELDTENSDCLLYTSDAADD